MGQHGDALVKAPQPQHDAAVEAEHQVARPVFVVVQVAQRVPRVVDGLNRLQRLGIQRGLDENAP